MSLELPGVFAAYGLEVSHFDQVGEHLWHLAVPGGELALRAIPRSGSKAELSLLALDRLIAGGFANLPRFHETKEGSIGHRSEHVTWLVSDWVTGHGATLGLTSDAVVAGRDLARLHTLADSLRAPEDLAAHFGRHLSRCRSRLKALRTYVLVAENRIYQTATDRVFLGLMEGILPLAERVIRDLEASPYRELAESDRARGAFIYHNMGEGGVVITHEPQPRAMFVDWSGCRLDSPVFDLCKLIGRVAKGSGGDPEVCRRTLCAYQSVRPLSQAEAAVLPLLLQFPQEFYAVAKRYYENKRDWTERSFTRRLRRAVDRGAALAACLTPPPPADGN